MSEKLKLKIWSAIFSHLDMVFENCAKLKQFEMAKKKKGLSEKGKAEIRINRRKTLFKK